MPLLPTGSRPLPNPGSVSFPTLFSMPFPPGNLACHLPLPPAMLAYRMPSPGSSPFTAQCWRRGADLNLKSCCGARSSILTQVRNKPPPLFFSAPRILPRAPQLAHRAWSACPTLKAQGSGQGQQVGYKQEGKGERSPVQRWRLKSGSGTYDLGGGRGGGEVKVRNEI